MELHKIDSLKCLNTTSFFQLLFPLFSQENIRRWVLGNQQILCMEFNVHPRPQLAASTSKLYVAVFGYNFAKVTYVTLMSIFQIPNYGHKWIKLMTPSKSRLWERCFNQCTLRKSRIQNPLKLCQWFSLYKINKNMQKSSGEM